jgi:2-oxoglutaroyl-CoA hydrolase
MTDPAPLLPALPDIFDGFRLEIDPARERADVILDRAPLNVITMAEREQLRAVFEALDADARVRVIVLRAGGEHFSSGGEIRGFLDASPEHVSRLAWNIAAPARCRKPVIAASRGYCFGVGFELALACDFRLVSARAASRSDPGFGRRRAPAEDGRHHAGQGHCDALGAHSWSASL